MQHPTSGMKISIGRAEQRDLKEHYEDVAAATLGAIFRWKWLIFRLVVLALVVAGLLAYHLPRTYLAEAIVHSELTVPANLRTTAKTLATLEGATLVASEAEFIRSRAMARRVASRLNMDEDKKYKTIGIISSIKSIVQTETYLVKPLEKAVDHLIRNLSVKSDRKSYNINIAISWDDPLRAAEIANTFVTEYIKAKRLQRLNKTVEAARSNFERTSSRYGPKHPAMVRADRDLKIAKAASRTDMNYGAVGSVAPSKGEGVTLAEPRFSPTGPNLMFLVALATALAVTIGTTLAIWLERRNTGFRSPNDAHSYTGLKCIGVLPKIDKEAGKNFSTEAREALRSIGIEARLSCSGGPKVVMITSTTSHELTEDIATGLVSALSGEDNHTLIIARKSQFKDSESWGKISKIWRGSGKKMPTRLDVLLADRSKMLAYFNAEKTSPLVQIELTEAFGCGAFDTALDAWDNFLSTAREHFDHVVVVTPPVFVYANAMLIARSADLIIYVAKWRGTPRRMVQAGVHRLSISEGNELRIALTDVDYRRLT